MENKKGNGIFLGVVSVATLIVAIIGATFAYFSASTESDEDALNLTAYEFKLSMTVEPIYPEGASSLIPLDPTTVIENVQGANNTNLLYALNEANKRCIDDNGLQVCALYRVTIENQATNEITLTGSIRTVTNTPGTAEGATGFTNLTYQALNGSHEDNSLTLKGDPIALATDVDGTIEIDDIVIDGATIDDEGNVTTPGTGTSYILVYLNENGNQSAEMGSSFTGQLIYSSTDGSGNTLTGTFRVSGNEEGGA